MATKVPKKKLQRLGKILKTKTSTLFMSSEIINMYSTCINTINLKSVNEVKALSLNYLISISCCRYQ